MSIRACDFYIMGKEKLPLFLKWAKGQMNEAMLNRFKKHEDLFNLFDDSFSKDAKLCMEKITQTMQNMTYSNTECYDLTCGVSIWLWNQYAVIKMYGLDEFVRSKLPRYVKDFHYQNSCEKPDNIDGREWARRSKFYWDTIDDLPRINYAEFDFLSNNRHRDFMKLRSYYRRTKKEAKDDIQNKGRRNKQSG
jgi:hypothetical protein